MQERLLPQKVPTLATLECAGICRPVRSVGGDYYDFLPIGAGRVGIAIGDVSGKGLSAALLMATLQATLRSFASVRGDDPRQILDDTNRQMCALTEAARFVTLFWGIYDDGRRELSYVNAGHNYPMLFRSGSGGAPERLESGGTVLGLFPQASWRERAVALAPGDLLRALHRRHPGGRRREGRRVRRDAPRGRRPGEPRALRPRRFASGSCARSRSSSTPRPRRTT